MTTETIARPSRLRQFAHRLVRPSRWPGICHARADAAELRNEWLEMEWLLLSDMAFAPPLIDRTLPDRIRRGEA